MSSDRSEPAPGRLGRIFNRGALAVALLGLLNAAIVFWFLGRTEADGTTVFLVGRQKALVEELDRLTPARPGSDAALADALSAAVRELDRSMTLLRDGGDDRGVAIHPAPAAVSAEVDRLERDWERLKQELASGGDAERVRASSERLSADADAVVATLRERRRVHRNILALLVGVSSLVVLGISFLGARFVRTRVVNPASGLATLARRAVDSEPPPALELPDNHELGGAVQAVSDLSARLQEVRSERDEAQADYDAVFDNSLAGIYRIEADGRVSLANAALADMLGYESADELIASVGDAHRELFIDPEHRERFPVSTDSERLPIAETKVRRKDGSELWVLESAHRSNQEVCEGVVFDITPRKRAFDALRRLTGRLMEIQDEERRRLARELHDSMGQLLAAMKMNLNRLEDTSEFSSETSELLRDSVELCEEASRQTRTMSHLLHPPLLDELGLEHAIRDYADGFEKRSGIEVNVDVDVPDRLPPALETCLFRFVQECLTNVHRHSGSERATIRLFRRDDVLYAQCEDEGHGMPEQVWRGDGNLDSLGVGLRGINARLDQLDGRLEIEPANPGTIVTAAVRLARETETPPR